MAEAKERATQRKMITHEHKFTQAEIVDLSTELAAKLQEAETLESRRKTMSSQIKAEIDECLSTVKTLSLKISNGSEAREFYCRVEFDYEKKVKHYYSESDGTLIRTDPMTAYDLQVGMDLEDDEEGGSDEDTLYSRTLEKYKDLIIEHALELHTKEEIVLTDFDDDHVHGRFQAASDLAHELCETITETYGDNIARDFLAATGHPIGEFTRRLEHDGLIAALDLLFTIEVNGEGEIEVSPIEDAFAAIIGDSEDLLKVIQSIVVEGHELDNRGDVQEEANDDTADGEVLAEPQAYSGELPL